MKTYDIGLFNLEHYQCTEALYDFYESIGWIEPEQITGYTKKMVKSHNLQSFNQYNPDDEYNSPDDLIADYYQYCQETQPNIEKFIDSSIWLITELADSTPAYIFQIEVKQYFKKNGYGLLNFCFEKIFNAFQNTLGKESPIINFLLVEFIFESFQYGSEWGVFVEPQGKPSITKNLMTVQDANQHDYLCAKLSNENIKKLVMLEEFNTFPKL